MKRCLTFLIVGALVSGCATPTLNPWSDLTVPRESATEPVDLPIWPVPRDFTESGATFTIDQIKQLDAYREASVANYAIASHYAAALNARHDREAALIQAGEAQFALTELQRQIANDERRRSAWEKLGLVVIAGLAVAL